MEQVSFPDINSSPTVQGVITPPTCETIPVPGVRDPRAAKLTREKEIALHRHRAPVLWMKSPDGTAKNQMGKDEGPLTLKRSETVDEEISAHVVDWLDRNDPKKTNKPFFCWYNPARMHITTMLSQKYLDMLGTKGGKELGRQREHGMKQLDDNIPA